MATVFRTRRQIEFCDTDMAGIVHFARFFYFMESAETEFLHSLGLSVSMPWEGKRLGLPRVSARCDYVMPITFEDFIDIEIEIEKLGNKSITYVFHFSKEGKPVAKGVTVACCVGSNEKRQMTGIPIPDAFRAKLLAVMHDQ